MTTSPGLRPQVRINLRGISGWCQGLAARPKIRVELLGKWLNVQSVCAETTLNRYVAPELRVRVRKQYYSGKTGDVMGICASCHDFTVDQALILVFTMPPQVTRSTAV